MIQAFIGGGGGSGVLILIGLAILVGVVLLSFAFGVIFAFKKKPKLAAPLLLIPLACFYYLYGIYNGYSEWKNRDQDFNISVVISSTGDYSVTVDGIANPEDLILIDGDITFHIDLPDSKAIGGTCSNFQSRRIDGEFGSIELGGVSIPWRDRSALIASMDPPPRGALYDAQTDYYTIWFRRVSPEFEWFTCARRIEQP